MLSLLSGVPEFRHKAPCHKVKPPDKTLTISSGKRLCSIRSLPIRNSFNRHTKKVNWIKLKSSVYKVHYSPQDSLYDTK